MTSPKILILVLAAEGIYTPLVKAIKETWGKSKEHEIFYYYGYSPNLPKPGAHEVLRSDNNIVVGCEETIGNITLKTVLTFEFVLKHWQFDYIFRCCCGSYIVPSELTKFITPQSRSGFYCGIIGQHHNVRFASGSGYFLSRDLVQLVANEKAQITKNGAPDDVALGAFLAQHHVSINPSARRTDLDDGQVRLEAGAYHYHFRHQVGLMYTLHRALNQ